MLLIKEVNRKSSLGRKILLEIYRMRLESYTSLGWNPFSKEDSKLIKDEFDESPHTVHFAIEEEGRIIGAHRSTKYSPRDKLPSLKDGHSLEVFKTNDTSIAELSRLVMRQDRKYPGCVLQLAHHVIKYSLDHGSRSVCTIGVTQAKDLFEFIGTRQVNEVVGVPVDQEGDKLLSIQALPMVGDKTTLNNNINFEKYVQKRTLYIIKPQAVSEWDSFWTSFSEEAYDYTNALPENRLLLEKISQLIGNNKVVLDCGCGTGNLSLLLAESNKVTAYDYNRSMLEITRKKTKGKGVLVRHGDVTKLRFKEGTFDAVASVNVLYHLDHPAKAISETYRVLKKGGLFILSSPLKGASLNKAFMQKVEKDVQSSSLSARQFERLREFNEVLFRKGGIKFAPTFERILSLLEEQGFRITHKQRAYYGMNFLISATKE